MYWWKPPLSFLCKLYWLLVLWEETLWMELRQLSGPLPVSHMIQATWMVVKQRWNDADRGQWTTRRKTCPSATLSSDPTGLTWTLTWATTVRSWRLTTWAMARPCRLQEPSSWNRTLILQCVCTNCLRWAVDCGLGYDLSCMWFTNYVEKRIASVFRKH
jgi:hypothetical protein